MSNCNINNCMDNCENYENNLFDSWIYIENIEGVNDIPENRMQLELNPKLQKETLFICQRELSIINKDSVYNLIGTYNLGPNIGLVGYDKKTNIAFACHFDINTKMSKDIFYNHLSSGEYDIYIIGGLTGYSELLIDGIFKLMESLNHVRINYKGRCVLGSVYDPKSIFINKYTGQIYTFSGPCLDPDFWNRGNKFTHNLIYQITPLQYVNSQNVKYFD